MEDLTSEQKRVFNKFLKIFSKADSLGKLDDFLKLVEEQKIQEVLDEINQLRREMQGDASQNEMSIKEAIEDIRVAQKKIDEVYRKIFDTSQEDGTYQSSVLNEMDKIKNFMSAIQKDYDRFYGEQGLIVKLEEACKKIESNQDKIKKFESYYSKVFEGIPASENNQGKPSLEEFLNQKKQDFEEILETENRELEKSKQELQELIDKKTKQIDELLPGAASAGLATAYRQEKENIQRELKKWGRIFWVSIGCFLVCFGIYFWVTFDESFSYVAFLRSLPIWIFSGFFTFHSTKQLAEYKRLASEYAHKEALSTTYTGYEKAIKESENDELKNKLLEIMIQCASFNPSSTLGKTQGEHPVSSIIKNVALKQRQSNEEKNSKSNAG